MAVGVAPCQREWNADGTPHWKCDPRHADGRKRLLSVLEDDEAGLNYWPKLRAVPSDALSCFDIKKISSGSLLRRQTLS
jgi:hypothetical protein